MGAFDFDIAVVGAGPAGLTAGIYAARAGMSACLFDSVGYGGQLAQTDWVENYPGFPEGANGFDLADNMKQQADRFGVQEIDCPVTAVERLAEGFRVVTECGEHTARAVVVATGARPRKLDVSGLLELEGRGVSYCATCDGNFFRGRDVVVVGGGDTAVADVLYLAQICRKVYLVHRRDQLRAAASYLERLNALDNVELVWNSAVAQVGQEGGSLASVTVAHVATGEKRTIPASGLFVAVGTVPNAEFLQGFAPLDEGGYVVAGEDGVTSVPGLFAAGDVRTKVLRQVVTAVSDGANAAQSAVEYLHTR
ncbi:MAG: thioredoxin-disulfide reductase [Coriobacteriia bacterium]|nr:thioredoxin-disulfide reductase [Coriobacteriia bacterium]